MREEGNLKWLEFSLRSSTHLFFIVLHFANSFCWLPLKLCLSPFPLSPSSSALCLIFGLYLSSASPWQHCFAEFCRWTLAYLILMAGYYFSHWSGGKKGWYVNSNSCDKEMKSKYSNMLPFPHIHNFALIFCSRELQSVSLIDFPLS